MQSGVTEPAFGNLRHRKKFAQRGIFCVRRRSGTVNRLKLCEGTQTKPKARKTKSRKAQPSNMQHTAIHKNSAQNSAGRAKEETAGNPNGNLARRTFVKRLGLGGTALLPASTALATRTVARAAGLGGGLTAGDAAI